MNFRPMCTAAAIPARDEADVIASCLTALDRQTGAQLDDIVLFVNNTRDDTAARARGTTLRPGTRLHIVEADLPSSEANAGLARRYAVAHAARLAGPTGLVLTTDADGRVDTAWLRNTLLAIEAGADVVAGFVSLDPEDERRLPARLIEDDARECAYDALLDEMADLLDPDPSDPAPRHTQASGASLAVRVGTLNRAGGMPNVASGEDRAFVAAIRRIDARLRHSRAVRVTVSGRIVGRAAGGMAETIARRLRASDLFIDDRLEPARAAARRAWLRGTLRRAWHEPAEPGPLVAVARRLGMPAEGLTASLGRPPAFGAFWTALEAESPSLARQRVPVAALARETALARALLAHMRNRTPKLLEPLVQQQPAYPLVSA